jgi:hypothetical protein
MTAENYILNLNYKGEQVQMRDVLYRYPLPIQLLLVYDCHLNC